MSILSADTIAALATAPLPAGVAIIRISGKNAHAIAQTILKRTEPLTPRQAHYGNFYNAAGEVIDSGLALFFPNPHSFTGEDVVELMPHGSPAVVESLLNATFAAGARQAQAGEFTRRAVLNGKMDLTAAEGLADLIAAETEAQRHQAQRQLAGELGSRFDDWRTQVLELLAQTEAAIDFPDEELEVLTEAAISQKLQALIASLQQAMATRAGQRLREGFQIAIIGKPNAGKSTLTNLLTGAETAIVSPIAGTTRDVVRASLNIGGFPVQLADTAGLRDTSDVIEAEGVSRAQTTAGQADLVIAVVDAAEWPELDPSVAAQVRDDTVFVLSKTDLNAPEHASFRSGSASVPLNLTDKSSLDTLLPILTEKLQKLYAPAQSAATLTRQRHVDCVTSALQHLSRGAALFDAPPPTGISELLAQDLRDAAFQIGLVTGRTTSEDVLDVVFSTFCVGK